MRVSGRVVFAFLGHVVRERKRRRVEVLRCRMGWAVEGEKTAWQCQRII